MKEDLNYLIFRKGAPRILVACKQERIRYCKLRITSEIEMTYSHVVKILAKLEKNKLVVIKKIGRNCAVSLTDEGIKVANLIEQLSKLLRISE